MQRAPKDGGALSLPKDVGPGKPGSPRRAWDRAEALEAVYCEWTNSGKLHEAQG